MKSSKVKELKPLPGDFVKCPISLLVREDVSPIERNLWLVLKARCMNKDSCHPSVRDLCSFTGIKDTWCRQLLDQMEHKGIIRTEHTNGRTKEYYPLVPDKPRHSTDAVESDPVTPPAGGRHSTGAVTPKPRHSTDDESDKEQIKETERTQPPADNSPSVSEKKSPKKKPSDPRVKQLIDYFCAAHEKSLHINYVVSGKRDGRIFKDLLEVQEQSPIQQCIDLLFMDTDEWLNGKRTIPVLRSRINTYLQQLNQTNTVPVPAAHRRLE